MDYKHLGTLLDVTNHFTVTCGTFFVWGLYIGTTTDIILVVIVAVVVTPVTALYYTILHGVGVH